MKLSTSIPPYGDHVVAPRETDLEHIVSIGKEEARRRERKICNSSNNDDDDLGDNSNSSEAFFVVDVGCIERKYHRWRQCFPRIKPFYAMKVNPHPIVVKALAPQEYCGFDCSSRAEISLALDCGVNPNNIIYAHPMKTLDDIKFAISRYVRTMTFDGECELHKIRHVLDMMRKGTSEAVPNEEELADVDLVLRIKVPDETSAAPLGEKFGAPFDECASLISTAKDLGLKIVGVSGVHDKGAFGVALKIASQVFKLAAFAGFTLTLLDIGGGFPGWDGSEAILEGCSFPHPINVKDVADATNPVLSELFTDDVQFIAEPGRYFVEASHTLFARIYATRPLRLRDENSDTRSPKLKYYTACFIAEGIFGCFKDKILSQIDYELMPLKLSSSTEQQQVRVDKNDEHQQRQPKGDCVFIGPSWRESDIVCLPSNQKVCPMPILHQGDWVYAVRMGAYTSSISYNNGAVAANSVSIQQDPPIYVIEPRNSDCL